MKKTPAPKQPAPTRPSPPPINLTEITTTIEGLIRESQEWERQANDAKAALEKANNDYNVLVGFVDGFLTPAWRASEPKFEIQPRLLVGAAKRMAQEMMAKQPTTPPLRKSSAAVRTKPLEVVPEEPEETIEPPEAAPVSEAE